MRTHPSEEQVQALSSNQGGKNVNGRITELHIPQVKLAHNSPLVVLYGKKDIENLEHINSCKIG